MPLALAWAARPMRPHHRRLLQRPGRLPALAPPAAVRAQEAPREPGLQVPVPQGLGVREPAVPAQPALAAAQAQGLVPGRPPVAVQAPMPLGARERPALAPAQRCRSAALPVRQALQA